MRMSSESLFFTGIVAILIIFQVTTTINFYLVNSQTGEIIKNQREIIELLTTEKLSSADQRLMEKLTVNDYKMCVEAFGEEGCTRYERLIKIKFGDQT